MSNAFYIPSLNLMGVGCLEEAVNAIKSHGFTKALIVTDKVLKRPGRSK